jgi:hypothetical protein
MALDDRLRAILAQIVEEHPGADEASLRELFWEAIENDEEAQRKAAKFLQERMIAEGKLRGKLMQIIEDNPDISEARLRE